jgi:hypothetical protein
MQPIDKVKRFKQETRYVHNRSEGLTRRKNKGSQYIIDSKLQDIADNYGKDK